MGWEKRPGFKGKSDDNVDREFDAQGFLEVDSKKAAARAPNTVLFIGDSNTFGYEVPTAASFAEVTERLLPGVKTMNLGIIGYTSYQGRKTLEKYLSEIRPAAVVACDIDEGTTGGSHNVIVPTTTNPPDRNYNKLRLRCLPLPKTAEWLVLMGPDGTLHFG
jgi:hypothetical protein